MKLKSGQNARVFLSEAFLKASVRTSRANMRSLTRWYSSSRSSMDLLRRPSCSGTRIWETRDYQKHDWNVMQEWNGATHKPDYRPYPCWHRLASGWTSSGSPCCARLWCAQRTSARGWSTQSSIRVIDDAWLSFSSFISRCLTCVCCWSCWWWPLCLFGPRCDPCQSRQRPDAAACDDMRSFEETSYTDYWKNRCKNNLSTNKLHAFSTAALAFTRIAGKTECNCLINKLSLKSMHINNCNRVQCSQTTRRGQQILNTQ